MTTHSPRLHLGSAYYPEHWPEERWPEDARLMKEAGMTVARMAEFAWSSLEPAPGEYRLDWLERAVQLLAEHEIVTVLGTPTAAPPAWLTHNYPDTVQIDDRGRPVQHGNRCHYCPTSPELVAASRRIVQAMAQRFGGNPNVIGWQIDNEFARFCYCDRCRRLFQEFLKAQYESLDVLNQRWSTAYWSQAYTAWEEIPIPIGPHNPGLMLEWRRFVTQANRDFQKAQIDVLRQYIPAETWITHNFMGWYDGFDHYKFCEDLDMASWDYYVGAGHHDPLAHAAIHDLTRGFKRKNFWVMETQPGSVNWSGVNNVLNKWEARAMAWKAIAHGAEGVLYWQWRSALGGQEQYHGSLVDQSGQPRPFYEEVKYIGREMATVSDLLVGASAKARIAMLFSYESRWSIQWQRHHKDFDYVQYFNSFYRPLASRNMAIDILGADGLEEGKQLSGYKLVIAPALIMLDDRLARVLKEYVSKGGYLVLTARTGMKDRSNAMLPARQPGPLAELASVEVEEYYALDEPVPVKGNWFEGRSQVWAERLRFIGGRIPSVIARYGKYNGWLDEKVAITVGAYSHGLVYYVGTYLDEAAQKKFIDRMLATAVLRPYDTPPGVTARTLVNPAGVEILIIINHTTQVQTVKLPWPALEHLTGLDVENEMLMPTYGVAILTKRST